MAEKQTLKPGVHPKGMLLKTLSLQPFKMDDSGGVTVDWVVLTGFVVGLGVAVASSLLPGMMTAGEEIVTRAEISTDFEP